jgi:hypothetical protein
VADLALCGRRSLDPLRGLAANTADHIGMSESLGSTLLGLHVESGGNRLRNARVQRGCPAGNQEVLISALVAGAGPAIAVASPRTGKGGMGAQGGRHGCD